MRKKLKKGETKRGIGPAGGAPVSKKTGKVFTGHKGTKRSVGPAGAPVSKKTGKVFTGKERYKDYIKRGLSTKAHADKLMKKYKETGDPKLKERIKKQLRLTKITGKIN